jgi:hypothetical protein
MSINWNALGAQSPVIFAKIQGWISRDEADTPALPATGIDFSNTPRRSLIYHFLDAGK